MAYYQAIARFRADNKRRFTFACMKYQDCEDEVRCKGISNRTRQEEEDYHASIRQVYPINTKETTPEGLCEAISLLPPEIREIIYRFYVKAQVAKIHGYVCHCTLGRAVFRRYHEMYCKECVNYRYNSILRKKFSDSFNFQWGFFGPNVPTFTHAEGRILLRQRQLGMTTYVFPVELLERHLFQKFWRLEKANGRIVRSTFTSASYTSRNQLRDDISTYWSFRDTFMPNDYCWEFSALQFETWMEEDVVVTEHPLRH